MSVRPRELLDSARRIYEAQTSESDCRAAISRAYYAAYHAARVFHASLPTPGRLQYANGLHEQLCEKLTLPTIPSTDSRNLLSRKIGTILTDALRGRVLADYRIEEPVSPEDAKRILEKCNQILKLLNL